MAAPDRFRVGVVGAGRIAQAYLSVLRGIDEVELVAVADTQPEVVRAASEAFSVNGYPDHQAMLEAEQLAGVVICTPPATHCEITMDALNSGRHVLCEKPIALSSAEVRRMIDGAQKHGKVLMMASKFRYVKDISSARALIQAGILGTVVRYENTFASWLDVTRRWNSDPALSGGGVLIDNGTHSADIVRYLLGPIERILACHGPRVQQIPVEDTSHILFQTTSGVIGTIDLSWSIEKERESYIEVFGTEGTLMIGWPTSRYRQNRSTTWIHFGKGYNKQEAFDAQVRNFVGSCRGQEKPVLTLDDALASVQVIEAAYASAAEAAWKRVPLS